MNKEEIEKQRMDIMEKHMTKTEKSDSFEVFFDYQKAMQEYSDQNTKPLLEEIAELRKTGLEAIKIAEDLSYLKKKYETRVEELQAENTKLKASKSEANEAVEFAEWLVPKYFNIHTNKWNNRINEYDETDYTTTELYKIFKTRNNK